MKYLIAAAILAIVSMAVLAGCAGDSGGGGGIYACDYEKRSSACGGGDYSDWEAYCYEFDMDDYLESWTPEMVCDKYSGSDLHCAGSCCIYVDYRNNELSKGGCDCDVAECI